MGWEYLPSHFPLFMWPFFLPNVFESSIHGTFGVMFHTNITLKPTPKKQHPILLDEIHSDLTTSDSEIHMMKNHGKKSIKKTISLSSIFRRRPKHAWNC